MSSNCPECGTEIADPCRMADGAAEFLCPDCGIRHTRKPGREEASAML